MFSRTLKFRNCLMLCVMVLLSLSIAIPATFAQQQNVCRGNLALTLEYGVPTGAEIDDDTSPFVLFCFAAERGDSVTVTVQPIAESGNLIPLVVITDSVAETIDDMVNNALGMNSGNSPLAAVTTSAEIDTDGNFLVLVMANQATEGRFEIRLDVQESQSLLSGLGGASAESTEESTGNDNSSTANIDETSIDENAVNLCELEEISTVEYGASLIVPLTAETPQALFCFEGSAGDLVQVSVGNASGEVFPLAILADPVASSQGNIVYAQDVAESVQDLVQLVHELPADGNYLIGISAANGIGGEVFMELTSSAQVPADFGCQSEPLRSLSQSQWGFVIDEEQDLSLTYNVSCLGVIIMNIFGGNMILEYGVTTDGILAFGMGDNQYLTVSVDEAVWVLESATGQEIVLSRLDGETCTAEEFAELIRGAWEYDGGNLLIDFMCNGTALLLNQGTPIIANYTLDDGIVELVNPINGQALIGGEVTVDGESMILNSEANGELAFINILSDAAELPDG